MCFVNWSSVVNLDLFWKQVFSYNDNPLQIKVLFDIRLSTFLYLPSFRFSPFTLSSFMHLNDDTNGQGQIRCLWMTRMEEFLAPISSAVNHSHVIL